MSRVILFVFAGRRPNIELQLPYIERILSENPSIEAHIWDLARDRDDSRYLRTIQGERITVRTDFYQRDGRASRGQSLVWKHYASMPYRDFVFVKLDDDDVFLETGSIAKFAQAAVENPEHVISALTINNGASTRHIPDLWAMTQQLGVPLLDVHLSADYAERSHNWFFANWQTITGQPGELIPTEDWVSINAIAYTWQMGRNIANLIGKRPPEHVAGRDFPYRNADGRMVQHRIGDEGAVNMQPRLIHTGFVAGHLNFGPQIKQMTEALYADLRKGYADVGKQYLCTPQ